MAKAGHKGHMGGGTTIGHPTVGTTDPPILDEDDLAGSIKARNNEQGDSGSRVRHQRTVLPGSQDERNQPDVVVAELEEAANRDDA